MNFRKYLYNQRTVLVHQKILGENQGHEVTQNYQYKPLIESYLIVSQVTRIIISEIRKKYKLFLKLCCLSYWYSFGMIDLFISVSFNTYLSVTAYAIYFKVYVGLSIGLLLKLST